MRFESKTVKAKCRTSHGARGDSHSFHVFTGSPSEFASFIRENRTAMSYAKDITQRWAGFRSESNSDAINAGVSRDAHKTMQANHAALEAPLKAPGRAIPSPVGGAFNIGRILNGHPLSAYRRPRVTLPPKTIVIALSVSCSIDESTISKTVSKIARAAWEYHLAGGIVNVTFQTLCFYSRAPASGEKGMLISLILPLADVSALATGASLQAFRGFGIPIMQAYSGETHDPLWPGDILTPGVFTLSGDQRKDDAILQSLMIKA